ncbi:heavy-metal-associated domain-containing protein [Campylobacter concisus]|uniref:heavy-metal-associated domain-containing protein n=1 Tax=Campylobacter concisus TaxID=199 RepID=UPI000CD8B862|nr:heavy-metal-associated domain-containing protein [Campylobacter concisus]QPH87606.1 heavy-metal-associated domain-containing protein [Campylobacter concisus]QPI02552.1 heavy-metal-associated domain-containing protein [Campylobacter concisus]
MKTFEANNIHCQNCANTIKNALEDYFGEIKVDLSKEPRQVSLDIKDSDVEKFKSEMADLGFDIIKEL